MEKRVFSFDELEKQKQKNVVEAYTRPGLGEILIVIDDTAFRGCRDGLILTENFIATKEMFQEPNYYSLDRIERIEFAKKHLILNGKAVFKFHLVEQDELDAFCAFLTESSASEGEENEDRGDGEPSKASESAHTAAAQASNSVSDDEIETTNSADVLIKPLEEKSKTLIELNKARQEMRGALAIIANRNRGSKKAHMQDLSRAEFISDIVDAVLFFHENLAKEARCFNEPIDLFSASPFGPGLTLSFIGTAIVRLLKNKAEYSNEWAFSYGQFPMFIAVNLYGRLGVDDAELERESIKSLSRSQPNAPLREAIFLEDFMVGFGDMGLSTLKNPRAAGYAYMDELIDKNASRWTSCDQRVEDGLKKLQQEEKFQIFVGNQFLLLLPFIEESVAKILKEYGPYDEHPSFFKFKSDVVDMMNSRLYG